MVVTTSNLYSQSREVLKNLIRSNVSDPKRGSVNSNRQWIHREFPDTTNLKFSGYPLIVLRSPDIGNDNITLNQLFKDNLIQFEIEIYAEFNDENARVDTLSDSILSTILSSAGQTTLANSKLYNPDISSSPYDNITIDGKQLSTRLITINLSTELCFS